MMFDSYFLENMMSSFMKLSNKSKQKKESKEDAIDLSSDDYKVEEDQQLLGGDVSVQD